MLLDDAKKWAPLAAEKELVLWVAWLRSKLRAGQQVFPEALVGRVAPAVLIFMRIDEHVAHLRRFTGTRGAITRCSTPDPWPGTPNDRLYLRIEPKC